MSTDSTSASVGGNPEGARTAVSTAAHQASRQYRDQGWVLLDNRVDDAALRAFRELLDDSSVHRVVEDDGVTLRSVYGFQQRLDFKHWLSRQSWLRMLLDDLLGPEVYVYQSKINQKNRLATAVWPYHRDFPFWHVFDGVPECRMVNVAIYLDDITPDCGPLKLLNNSHRSFLPRESQGPQPDYTLQASAGADLAFAFSDSEVQYLRSSGGERSAEGPRGSVLLFHPQTVHGSGASNRDASRRVMLLTFNACDNRPVRPEARPDFLCARDCSPVHWAS